MTTVDRADSLLDTHWAPETVSTDYVGRHRLRGFRVHLTARRLFYIAKHRR
ncbi:MAG TPA: hypothetical protein VFU35_10280 [Jatrophihabitans sp.]|nr:hypothetical protein [Jatrophihabitans sp.]